MKLSTHANRLCSQLLILGFVLLFNGCSKSTSPETAGNNIVADSIYFGGTIITMNDSQPNAEAVAVKNGKIVAVGARAEVDGAYKGTATTMIDLAGKTLVPGFIDGHSHFSEVGMQTVLANLLPPPDGTVKNIAELQQAMRDFIATSPVVKAHGIAVGMNYDDSQLAERRHPTRQELDAISTDLPIMISHQSGHFGVLNSKALAKMGLTAESVNPVGGVIQREADGVTPNGVLEENAFFGIVYKMFPAFTPEEITAQLRASENIYLANGFTTIQEGKTTKANLNTLIALAEAGKFKADIVSYPDIVTLGDDPVLHGTLMSRSYTNHLRIGGVKLTLDGSPQGKTGWFTIPYFKVPAGQPDSYSGYPAFSDEKLTEWIMLAYKNNWQVIGHCSGDAAIDQFIKALRAAQIAYPGSDHRPVIIHGHFIRADQIPAIKELGVFVSAFPLHTFNWGDWHRESVVGPERAENISPTGWFLTQGVKFSIHSDAPVIFPNSMQLIGTAVNRTTRTGYVLGAEHRLEPLTALKAMTLWPAYQHFEEARKGSIETGKLADFVVLSENPLTFERANLNQIKVLETIKEGHSVYRADL
jgi:predicted amidohydrolase YtcJ